MAIETKTLPPAPEGMNTQVDSWALADNFCRYLQDALTLKPLERKRRGPVRPKSGVVTFPNRGLGIVGTHTPDDIHRIAVLHGANAGTLKLGVLSSDYTTKVDIDYSPGTALTDYTKKLVFDAKPAFGGGTWIGVSYGLRRGGAAQCLGLWYGGNKADYSTGQISATRGSATITGVGTAFLTNAAPGMFVTSRLDIDIGISGSRAPIGVVKSIESDTSLTMEDESPFAVTTRNYTLTSVRPPMRLVAKGRITTATTNNKVNGASTKFDRQGLATPSNSGRWAIFRADDMEHVGNVSSVQSDIQLTLTANALVNCNKDKYIAMDLYPGYTTHITGSGVVNKSRPGFLNAVWASRQWYANRAYGRLNRDPISYSRVWFSDPLHGEAVDYTADGDHILIPSARMPIKPIVGIHALPSCLVIFKEDETYAIFGTDETNFAVRKILDDGALSTMSVQPWNDGLVWAGLKGIWFFDGSETFNILEDRLVDYYEESVQDLVPSSNTAWSLLFKNQYVVNIEKASPPFGPNKTGAEGAGTIREDLVVNINLDNRACSIFTNMGIRGSIRLPLEETQGTWYIVDAMNNVGPPRTLLGCRICVAEDLFEQEGIDTIFTDNAGDDALGPDFYMESKRYDLGDPQLKKRFKQLQMHYALAGGEMKFATIIGLNEVAAIAATNWPVTTSGTYQNKRKKFNKRSQFLAFRIWQNDANITKFRMGPLALGFRPMRKGRI